MSTDRNHDDIGVGGEVIEPAGTGDPQAIADEQFIHGLLGCLHEETASTRRQRVNRVLEAITEADAAMSRRWWRRTIRPLSAAAAVLLVVLVIVVFGFPGRQSAYAIVQASIDASRTAGDRRYEVFIMKHGDEALSAEPVAVMDLGEGGYLLVKATTPEGHQLVIGRDGQGEWTIRRDGSIERFRPEDAWPRWVNLGESTILIEAVDTLLARLAERYELELADAASLDEYDSDAGRSFDRVNAELLAEPGADPERIELWISPQDYLVHRMTLQWPRLGRQAGVDAERPPLGRPPVGDRPPPVRRDDRFDGSFGAAPPLPLPPPHLGPRPQLLHGPPRFAEGRNPPPPKMIVFQRIEIDELPAAWFEPQSHAE